jgi:hypothetical protein
MENRFGAFSHVNCSRATAASAAAQNSTQKKKEIQLSNDAGGCNTKGIGLTRVACFGLRGLGRRRLDLALALARHPYKINTRAEVTERTDIRASAQKKLVKLKGGGKKEIKRRRRRRRRRSAAVLHS